ncbi:hypothetical protein [Cohaesibacter haloalkalitolerans]|uniref:hypothetical protein n=1 Tax=Cohaesibacter haloalkalitolerans TaxID=1162980 RepID=UPI0013C51205|nr:hypothetical protein [Cohaesibacter haloalkalitolerans]
MRLRKQLSLGFVMAALLTPNLAMAQSSPDSGAQAATTDTALAASSPSDAKAVIKENLFTVVPTLETAMTEEGSPVNLSFSGSPNTETPVDLSGISAKGFTRTVTVDGEKIAQVVVTNLSNEDDASVALSADKFTSQFNIESDMLEPTTAISVNGNEKEFVTAVKSLQKTPSEEEEDPEEKDTENGTDRGTSTSGGGSANDIAGSYQTPERIEPEEEEPEDTVEVRVTTVGCPVVIDETQGVVRVQSKSQTFTNGTMTSEDACTDNGTTYTIQKSYATCSDMVDLDGKTASPQYLSYYIDAEATRKEISDCQPDTEKTYKISEIENGCSVSVDIDNMKVSRNTSLVYTNGNNTQIKVQDCSPSETLEPYKLVADSYSCTMKHDFSKGVSSEMVMYAYEGEDGNYYQVTPCTETGNRYQHSKVFYEGGIRLCPVLVNKAAGTATEQYRTQIMVDGKPQYISACVPDTANSTTIEETTNGCDDPGNWTHDLSAGVSYGQSRFYYDTKLGREYVTGCMSNTTTYPHNVTVTGWKNNDEALFAQQLVSISINVNGTEYPIASNYLMDGTAQISYAHDGFEDIADPKRAYYETCNLFYPSNRSDVYTRPDGSKYSVPIGDGATKDQGDKCVRMFDGWKNNDEELYAQKLVSITLNVDGVEKQIESAYLADGAEKIPYTHDGIEEVEDSSRAYYDACNLLYPSNKSDIYTRPDGTQYAIPIGDGAVVDKGDKCVRSVVSDEVNTKDVVITSNVDRKHGASVMDTTGQIIEVGTGGTVKANLPTSLNFAGTRMCQKGWNILISSSARLTHYKAKRTRTKIEYPEGAITYADETLGDEFASSVQNLTYSHQCYDD